MLSSSVLPYNNHEPAHACCRCHGDAPMEQYQSIRRDLPVDHDTQMVVDDQEFLERVIGSIGDACRTLRLSVRIVLAVPTPNTSPEAQARALLR